LLERARGWDDVAVGFHQREVPGERLRRIRHRLLERITGRDAAGGTSGKLTP
jgi:hypothetical protein